MLRGVRQLADLGDAGGLGEELGGGGEVGVLTMVRRVAWSA